MFLPFARAVKNTFLLKLVRSSTINPSAKQAMRAPQNFVLEESVNEGKRKFRQRELEPNSASW